VTEPEAWREIAHDKPGDPADRATDAKADGAFQGSHRAGYGDLLARVEGWLRKHPSATLASGEGWALVQEIDRLRAAIERVRALHRPETRRSKFGDKEWDICSYCEEDGLLVLYPCATIDALDGEDA
jgi:hypothetical protein